LTDLRPPILARKNTKTNKKRLVELNQLDAALAWGNQNGPLLEKAPGHGKVRKERHELKGRKRLRSRYLGISRCGRSNFKVDDNIKRFPNFKKPLPSLKRAAHLSSWERRSQRRILVHLALQVKDDIRKLKVIQELLVGSVIRTNIVGVLSAPYVKVHSKGWVMVCARPSLRAAKELLFQLLNCFSSFLGLTREIQSRYESIDSERTTVQTICSLRNQSVDCSLLMNHIRCMPSSQKG
jgi:hypothetical protein